MLVDSRLFGEVAERFKAAVLRTVEGQPSGGSNPSLSAIFYSTFSNCVAVVFCSFMMDIRVGTGFLGLVL